MTKKSIFISSGLLTGISAATIGVAVPIALRDVKTQWVVNIANKNGSRYVLTQLDSKQNKPTFTDSKKAVWDTEATSEAKDSISNFLNLTDASQVQPAVSKGQKYTNGLEKLFFDLTVNFQKISDSLLISFDHIDAGENISIGKKFNDSNLNKRKEILKQIVNHDFTNLKNIYKQEKANSTLWENEKWNNEIVVNSGFTNKNAFNFIKSLKLVYLYNNSLKKLELTTDKNIKDAFLKVSK